MTKAQKGVRDRWAAVPAPMKEARRWLLWRTIDGRKVPYYVSGQPRKGTLDTAEDLGKLGTFEEVIQAYHGGRYTGIGFALGTDGKGGYWQGIDLDHIDEHPELAELVDSLPSYVERSPSGKGVHALGYGGRFKNLASNGSGVECYCEKRFFTVTGDAIRGGDDGHC